MQTRLFYIDDSGAGQTGYAVYAWLACDITAWTAALSAWLALRRELSTRFGIPSDFQLHAGTFLTGHGRPSRDAGWNLHKSNRIAVAELALQTIARCDALSVGAVYRRFVKPTRLGIARAELYEALLARLDRWLADNDSLGLLLVDGDGTDPAYEAAHRSLDLRSRRIVEDPLFQVSRRSQWIQMADLVAYAAYQSLLRQPSRRYCWTWYDDYLRPSDPDGGPVEL